VKARVWSLEAIALLLGFVLLSLSLAPAFAQQRSAETKPKAGGVYRRPLDLDPATLDPARISDIYGVTVAQQLFDGLVSYDHTLTIRPELAQSWTASRDWLIWTFHLRKGVKFHHGREVTADDVVYSFTRILDPRVKSGAADLFMGIRGAQEFREGRAKKLKGLEALDRYTVRVSLLEASAPFVAVLAIVHARIVPRELVEERGEAFGQRPVGTGPFRFVRWQRNREIILEANPDYYGGRPFLDRLDYRVFPGTIYEQMWEEFTRGELEDTPIPAKDRARLIASDGYQYIRRPMFSLRFYGLNTKRPPLNDRRVRQAIHYAFDRATAVEQIHQKRFTLANGILPPGTLGYNPTLSGYSHNVAKARQLLEQAGFPNGKGLPPITFWSSAKFADLVLEHQQFKKDLSGIGITLELSYNTDWPSFSQMLREGKAHIFQYAWYADIPDPDNFLFKLFHSQSPRNYTFYTNPGVDQLLLQARAARDQRRRVDLYRKAEQLIIDDSPVVPVIHHTYERLFQPYVRSIEVNGLGDPYIPMRKIWLDRK
jgi:peptide/nickel transport system substrate-binding protein/oligopeptide transport system substrate-binding protein